MKSIRYLLIFLFLLLPVRIEAAGSDAESAYQKAAACYHEVKALPQEEQSRAKWHNCITLFEIFSRAHSKSGRAPDAIFSAGLSYKRIYEVTKNEADARSAISKFNELVRMHPKSKLADDALFNIGKLDWEVFHDPRSAKRVMLRIVSWFPKGDMASHAEDYLEDIEGGKEAVSSLRKPGRASKYVRLTRIERSGGAEGEKITLEMSGPADFVESHGAHSLPNFGLYTVELAGTYLSRTLDSGYSYTGKGIVRDIIPSQASKSKAQINIVIKEGNHCEARPRGSSLEIVCLPGKPVVAGVPAGQDSMGGVVAGVPAGQDSMGDVAAGVPAGQERLAVVIDPGHGGTDTGAVGPSGTREKDVALQIAKRLGWQLRNKLGMDVNYTRIDDRSVSLDDRSTIANGYRADLFISVHANAAENERLDGYQTFFLNNATDEAARKLAAHENASLGKSMDDVEKIILTMMQNVNTDESRLLAESIHKKVLSKMSKYGLKDRRVKSALFYVLVGAKCPAVLIETSFISNPDEEKKLTSPNYQESMVQGIADGIKAYLVKTKTANANL